LRFIGLGSITVFLLIVLLIWGNVVAGLGAGLACPDWPLCYGKYIAPLRWDIVLEKGHRVLAAITGLFIVALCVSRGIRYGGFAKAVPVMTVLLLALQDALGAVVVLLELPVNATTLHFAIAMLIFSIVLYLAYYDGSGMRPTFSLAGVSAVFFFFALLVLAQSMLGAYVRHSKAGLACGSEFPKCLGFWVPGNLSGSVLIHYSHRSVAYLLFLTALVSTAFPFVSKGLAPYRFRLVAVLALIVLQIGVGVGVIYTRMDGLSVAFHLLIAIMILSILADSWFHTMGGERS